MNVLTYISFRNAWFKMYSLKLWGTFDEQVITYLTFYGFFVTCL